MHKSPRDITDNCYRQVAWKKAKSGTAGCCEKTNIAWEQTTTRTRKLLIFQTCLKIRMLSWHWPESHRVRVWGSFRCRMSDTTLTEALADAKSQLCRIAITLCSEAYRESKRARMPDNSEMATKHVIAWACGRRRGLSSLNFSFSSFFSRISHSITFHHRHTAARILCYNQ